MDYIFYTNLANVLNNLSVFLSLVYNKNNA